ncbi:MAG: hypothetical protein J6K24_03710 [Tidjanibacter sp.]|nr:hypothetical protein [Tidjanibacter sp.]
MKRFTIIFSRLLEHSLFHLPLSLWIYYSFVDRLCGWSKLSSTVDWVMGAWCFAVPVVLSLILRRAPRDPLANFSRALSRVDLVALPLLLLFSSILPLPYLTEDYLKATIAVAVLGALIISVVVNYHLHQRATLLERELAESQEELSELRRHISQKYGELGEYLTLASITENNPELFMQHFRTFFNVGEGLFGNLLEVADGCFGGLLSQLSRLHPEATREDMALCALLLWGFSPTAVGLVFGNSKPSSIYNRRYRLRKHLAIPPEQNVEGWLVEQMRLHTLQ